MTYYRGTVEQIRKACDIPGKVVGCWKWKSDGHHVYYTSWCTGMHEMMHVNDRYWHYDKPNSTCDGKYNYNE